MTGTGNALPWMKAVIKQLPKSFAKCMKKDGYIKEVVLLTGVRFVTHLSQMQR